MNSNKSSPTKSRVALEPQRSHGKLRVAALLEAGAAIIAKKGFQAATMAEIASKAGAPIGSLYRFFPNKEILAQSLIRRYVELVNESFTKIEHGVKNQPTSALADALLNLMVDLHGETQAVVALLNVHSPKRREFRAMVRQRIARLLQLRRPRFSTTTAEHMAAVLLHTMKAMVRLNTEEKGQVRAGAMAELREMTRLYLANKLGA